jgi:cytoskeletal protein CcmA (bactofilin family)
LSTRRPVSRQPTPTPAPAENGARNGQRNSVVLGPNDRLVGQLYIEGDLHVTGTVEGQLEATGDIEISGAGKVHGDVTAYNRLTVGGDASLIAQEVHVARLTVEDGATFSGKVSMGKPKPKPVAEPVPEPVPEPVAIEVPAVYAAPEPMPEPVIVEAVPAVQKPAAKPVQAKPIQAKPVQQKGKPIFQPKGKRR